MRPDREGLEIETQRTKKACRGEPAALCVTGVRERRCLSQKGFELANGLPFVASDPAIHELLDAHTGAEAQGLQVALGRIRRASGHYAGKLLQEGIDPRIPWLYDLKLDFCFR